MTSLDTAKSGSRTTLATTGTRSAMVIGATLRALVIRGSHLIHGDGCPIAMAGGCSSTDAAGAGRRAAGTDGIAGPGWRTRLRDFILQFRPRTGDLSIATLEEITTSHRLP